MNKIITRHLGIYLGITTLLALVCLLNTTTVSAATINVNTTRMTSVAEGTAQPGECSIIDAYEAAFTDSIIGGCAAGDPVVTTSDTVVLPAGIFDLSPGALIMWDSASLRGAGSTQTILTGSLPGSPIGFSASESTAYTFRDFSLQNIDMTITGNQPTPTSVTMSSVDLHSSSVVITQETIAQMTTLISDVKADTASSGVRRTPFIIIDILPGNPNPGNTIIRNVTMNGGFSDGVAQNIEAIKHKNGASNARLSVENSIITNYKTGIYNFECSPYSAGGE